MSDSPTYEDTEAAGARMMTSFDQYAAISRTMMKSLATVEQACITAGMSERLSALFTMKVAEGFGWPVTPGSEPPK